MEKDNGLMLFGVRIDAPVAEEENDILRKSKSLGDLQEANHQIADKGYLSDGGLIQSSRTRIRQERKRGVPWSEEEHRTFLIGLEKLGKGDWRGISRNFVKTRTPTQVASHAQKYFLRQSNQNKRKRRSSLFDVGIKDNTAFNSHEMSTETAMKQIDAVTERSYKVIAPSNIPSPVTMPVSEAVQTLSMSINYKSTQQTENTTLLGGNSTFDSKLMTSTICPTLLQLSLPIPVQQHENHTPFSSSDLELSIAPPKPHLLPKLPAQPVPEAIWVT